MIIIMLCKFLILRIGTYKNADFVLSIRHPERLILSTQSGVVCALSVRCVQQGKRRKEEKNRIEDKERDKKKNENIRTKANEKDR